MQGSGSMHGKLCVVTGATSGIGRETAVELAAAGARVLLVGRSKVRGAEALAAARAQPAAGEAEFLAADFSSQAAVRQLADTIRAKAPRIDVLVNNAGGGNHERCLTVDNVEETFAVNHLAPFLLTRCLQDRFGPGTRIVTVSSLAHRLLGKLDFDDLQGEKGYSRRRAYAVSKLANVLFTYELARRLQGTGVTANCLHPGIVRTGIWQSGRGVAKLLSSLMKPFMTSSERSARSVVRLAVDPALEGVSGRYFDRDREVRSSALSYDQTLARKLWQTSEALLR